MLEYLNIINNYSIKFLKLVLIILKTFNS